MRDLLHWVNLITNRAQQEHPKQFPADGRADALLLKNLRYVRSELRARGLAQDHCHDLLARVIFTQFLFHRKDSDGHAFFSPAKMRRLKEEGTLSRYHESLASLLTHKADTYALFRWMDERFNGDLFPGKDGEDEDAREVAWRTEKNAVSAEKHLSLLAGLVSGTLDVRDKQHTLWPHYSFDTIPLEFISSVYEEFLTAEERGNDKAYYTPSHLVDYVLDAVLPWGSDEWDVRILDPCCGSGIFLVKAFQRLIHRWKRAKGREPLVTDLRPILERNLVGVDKNPEAVRVACFSLYLAMADAIEPKHYITRDNTKVFPRLRGTRLIRQDFFDEEAKTTVEKGSFDYVLGNAPWGDGSIFPDKLSDEEKVAYRKRIKTLPPTPGQKWAKANDWPVANNDIGPIFLAKAATLAKPSGFVAMVNTAQMLLRKDGLATQFRSKIFRAYTFDEITNLTALRKELFPQADGPSCVVVFSAAKPRKENHFTYYAPKPSRAFAGARGKSSKAAGFSVEPYDIGSITHEEAATESDIWTILSLGCNRDRYLLQKLKRFPNLDSLSCDNKVICRSGIIPGDQKQELLALKDVPYFAGSAFPTGTFLTMDSTGCPPWRKPLAATTYATNPEAFKSPQVLIKVSPVAKTGRIRAVRVSTRNSDWGVVCTKSFLTVRDYSAEGSNVDRACVAYNSNVAAYWLHLTSGRSLYNTEMLLADLRSVPLPNEAVSLASILSFEAIDEFTQKAFGLTAADRTLIEDFLEYTLPYVLRKTPGKARFPTQRKNSDGIKEPELVEYAKTFTRVLKGTFGKDQAVAATIFTDPEDGRLPVRMLTIHLDSTERTGVNLDAIEADGLLDQLAKLHTDQLKQQPRNTTGGGLGFQRVAWFFHPSRENGKRMMNLTIVKPDERRYWTRSMAMRDADQLASSIMKAAGGLKK